MNINLIGAVNKLSYGVVTCAVNHFLKEVGCNVSLFPLNPHNLESNQKYIPAIQESLHNAKFFDPKAPCIRIYHQHSLDMFVGSKRIGWPIFELDTFTEQEKHHLKNCDYLFVCSEWAKSIILDNLGNNWRDRVFVVPLGVDTEIFTPKTSDEEKVIILNVGKLEIRKGHDILYNVFNDSFSSEMPVELWMMWDTVFPYYDKPTWEKLYRNTELGTKIKFIPSTNDQLELVKIMQKADYGIFPSKAEGWNLPLLEMMACGKKSIVTNYSGHTEFCNSKNSFLIEKKGMELAYDGVWFKNQGNWAVFDNDDFSSALTKINTKSSIDYTCVETAKKFDWRNTCQTIQTILNSL